MDGCDEVTSNNEENVKVELRWQNANPLHCNFRFCRHRSSTWSFISVKHSEPDSAPRVCRCCKVPTTMPRKPMPEPSSNTLCDITRSSTARTRFNWSMRSRSYQRQPTRIWDEVLSKNKACQPRSKTRGSIFYGCTGFQKRRHRVMLQIHGVMFPNYWIIVQAIQMPEMSNIGRWGGWIIPGKKELLSKILENG